MANTLFILHIEFEENFFGMCTHPFAVFVSLHCCRYFFLYYLLCIPKKGKNKFKWVAWIWPLFRQRCLQMSGCPHMNFLRPQESMIYIGRSYREWKNYLDICISQAPSQEITELYSCKEGGT